MSRKRTVNPDGNTRNLSVLLPEPVYMALKTEAASRGISVGQLVRIRLTAK